MKVNGETRAVGDTVAAPPDGPRKRFHVLVKQREALAEEAAKAAAEAIEELDAEIAHHRQRIAEHESRISSLEMSKSLYAPEASR